MKSELRVWMTSSDAVLTCARHAPPHTALDESQAYGNADLVSRILAPDLVLQEGQLSFLEDYF